MNPLDLDSILNHKIDDRWKAPARVTKRTIETVPPVSDRLYDSLLKVSYKKLNVTHCTLKVGYKEALLPREIYLMLLALFKFEPLNQMEEIIKYRVLQAALGLLANNDFVTLQCPKHYPKYYKDVFNDFKSFLLTEKLFRERLGVTIEG